MTPEQAEKVAQVGMRAHEIIETRKRLQTLVDSISQSPVKNLHLYIQVTGDNGKDYPSLSLGNHNATCAGDVFAALINLFNLQLEKLELPK